MSRFPFPFLSTERLSVLEAWDEATSENPSGRHDDDSLYKAGRAATLTLANDLGLEGDLDTVTLERLGQLAVCAGFDLVRRADGESRLEVAVSEDGWWPSDRDEEERRTMFWQGLDTVGERECRVL